jgi:hypothetical protein
MPRVAFPKPQFLHDCLLFLAGLLALTAWLTPDHYPPWNFFYHEFAAFLGLWLVLVYCTRGGGQGHVRAPRLVPVIGAIALIPLAQAALGHIYFAGDGWMAAAYVLGLALAVAVGFVLASQDAARFAASMAWLFLLAGLLSTLLALHQWLGLDWLGLLVDGLPIYDQRPYANLGQANHLASLLCLGLASVLYLRASQRLACVPAALFGLLLIFGIAVTQSRTPWLGAIVLVSFWIAKRKSVPQFSGAWIGAGLLVYAGLIAFWPQITGTGPQAGAMQERAYMPAVPAQRSDLLEAGTHLINWKEMIRAAGKRPWSGYGWNQVTVAHVQTAHERPTYAEMLSHSHNLLLDVVIWNGLPLGALIIAGLAWWLATRAWRCRTPESGFALLVIGFIGAHAMVEYPLEYAYFLLPAGLLAGLVEADQGKAAGLTIPKRALWPVIAVYALFMGRIWHEYRIVEADYRLMRFEARNIGPLKAAQPAPDLVLLTQLREDLRMARSLAREDMSVAELEWMRRVTYRYPYYSNLFRYSVSLALNHRQQEASVGFRRLYDIYGAKPYANAKDTVRLLADTRYPVLKTWQLPPP